MTKKTVIHNGWTETTLGEVVEILDGDRGANYPNGKDFLSKGYCIFLNTKNTPNSLFSFSEKMFITKEKDELLRKGKLKRGDFVLTTRGTIGNFAHFHKKISYKNIRINSGMVILRMRKIDQLFFKFYLKSFEFKHQMLSLQSGSAQPQLPIRDLKTFTISLPPLPEQKAIATVLSSLDDKIELLREQNKTLEIIGQSIFKKWFGKYQIGDELPEEWRIEKIGEEFNISIGRTPPRKESQWFSKTPTGKKWISIKDMVNSGTYIFNSSEYLTDEAIIKFNIPIIPQSTVILSFKMTVGKLAITTENMLSNEAIAHLKIKENSSLTSEFIYSYLQNLNFNSLGSTSSIVTAINSTIIKNLEIIIPEKDILKNFNQVVKPLFRKIKNNSEQIQTLSRTRDILLPKLMRGDMRVKNF